MTYFYLIYREICVFLRLREFNIPRKAKEDMMLSTLTNDPTQRMLPKDPMDPIENADPLEPMDIKELWLHKLKTEFVEPTLNTEVSSVTER